MVSVVNPYQMFCDKNGNPLDNGKLYIGKAGVNPKGGVDNLQPIFLDDAFTKPCENPVNILNGYLFYQNQRINIHTQQERFSIAIDDKNDTTIASNLDFKFNTQLPTALSGITIDNSVIGGNVPSAGTFTNVIAQSVNTTSHTAESASINNLSSQSVTTNNLSVDNLKINILNEDTELPFIKGLIKRGGILLRDSGNFLRIFKRDANTGAETANLDLYDTVLKSNVRIESPSFNTTGADANNFEGGSINKRFVGVKVSSDNASQVFYDDVLLDNNEKPFIQAYVNYNKTTDSVKIGNDTRNNDGTSTGANSIEILTDKTVFQKKIELPRTQDGVVAPVHGCVRAWGYIQNGSLAWGYGISSVQGFGGGHYHINFPSNLPTHWSAFATSNSNFKVSYNIYGHDVDTVVVQGGYYRLTYTTEQDYAGLDSNFFFMLVY